MKNTLYLLTYAWRKSKLLFFTTSLKYIFTGFLPLIGVIGIGSVVKALENQKSTKEIVFTIVIYLSANLAISLINIVLTLFNNLVMRKASDITQMDYVKDCIFINYHYVEDKSVLDLKKKSMGANPVWFLDDFFSLLLYIIQIVGVIALILALSPWFLLLILLISSLVILINFKKKKIDFDYETAEAEDNQKLDYLYHTMSDYKYAKDIRINQAGNFILKKYDCIMGKLKSKTEKIASKKLVMDCIIAFIAAAQSFLIYFYFSWQATNNQITIADYTVLLSSTILLISTIIGFFESIGKIKKTLSYTNLFSQYHKTVKENSNIELENIETYDTINWNKIEIRFNNVCFSYPNSKEYVLNNINLTIHPGEQIALVGLNGSGKTTLIKLLMRLYDPTSGQITVNGIDIRNIPHKEYVKHFGIVLQDFCIFAYSVKENIVFDNKYDEKLFFHAIEESGLSKKILELEKGINTSLYKYLDDTGVEFSGGESQKLSIARAIYKKADFMILDEPTSALDPLSEYDLFEQMSSISKGKSTILISHRLSSTTFCDTIYVISKGEIIEAGNHDSLMKKDGFYAELFSSQAKYYERNSSE